MSGITDLPFRRLVHRWGAGMVVAEMAASKMLVAEHGRTLKRIVGTQEIRPHVIQIAGREPEAMAEAARLAADLGADMVDINMGCPARKVTKGAGGSALMKEPDLALKIVEAVIGAVDRPVSLKMRLGWDQELLNAAAIAGRAEQAGIQMFTVHGRTRNQFYSGRADWRAIRDVVDAVKVPVYANGDILSCTDAVTCLRQSGASGVMIGRGAQGRPWFVGQVGRFLATGRAGNEPSLAIKKRIILTHYEDMLSFYGTEIGVRNARKHLGWYVERLVPERQNAAYWRGLVNQAKEPHLVITLIGRLFESLFEEFEAAS